VAVQYASVSVTTTATRLSADDPNAQSILFNAPAVVYLGPAGVTSATGYAVTPGVDYAFDLGDDDDLYAITASGTVVVPVLRTGV